MIRATSLPMELSEPVTTPTILICNINNETIKMYSSCKQLFTVQCIQLENTVIFMMIFIFLYVNTLALHTKDLKI